MPAYNEAPQLPGLLARFTKVLSELEAGAASPPGKGGLSARPIPQPLGAPSLRSRGGGSTPPISRSHRYVVVDDGSTDRTPQILRQFADRHPLDIITHRVNEGLGASLRDALYFVAEHANDDDVVVTMDADDTHPPELLPGMLARLAHCDCDVVIASRYRRGARTEGLGARRRLMSFGARLLFQIVFPIPGVRDYTSGFRLYRVHLIKQAFDQLGNRFCDRPGFDCTADILLRLAGLGGRFREVPMVLHYGRKGTASKMRVARTVFDTLNLMLQRRFES